MLSNFLLIFSFSFFKSARCLVLLLSLFSFFSLSELSNFLNSSFLRQHLCRYALPICNDPQGEQRINPWVISWVPLAFCCYFALSIRFFCQDVSQQCHDKLHLKSYHALSLRNCATFDSLWLVCKQFQITMTANWPINKQITKKSLLCNSLSHNY